MVENWLPQTRKLSELKAYEFNPRQITEAAFNQLKKNIKEQGFRNPVNITQDNIILAGHQRLKAMIDLVGGDFVINVMVAPSALDEQQIKRIVASDNLSFGDFDFDILANHFEIEDLLDIGFDPKLFPMQLEEGLTDEDAVPPLEVNPQSKRGDIWVLGMHRVMCGDSTDITDVEKLMGGAKADQLVTDPPYNVDYEGSDGQKIKNDSMKDADFRLFLRDAFTAAFSVMKAGASFYIWHADLEGYNFRGAVIDGGQKVRSCLIWNKPSIVMGRSDYHWKHEPCLYGWKEGAGHLWASDRKQSTVLDFEKTRRNDLHPTMKPVSLIEYCINNNTKGSDLVLDLFGGSGSTLIACEKTGRIGYLMELDPKYTDVIVKRWQEFTGKEAVHAETGIKFNALPKSTA